MDARNYLFSYKGEPPEYLPEKIRLPNGLTRYSHSVTQEELESCGYRGPVVCPDCARDEYLEWDADSNTLRVCIKTSPMLCCEEDSQVRGELAAIVANRDLNYRSSLTAEGRDKYDLFYGTVQNLLATNYLLTFDDIPNLSIDCFEVEKTRQEYIASSGYLEPDDWQFYYEEYGICVPHAQAALDCYENDVMYTYLSTFVPPSSWVPSGSVLSDSVSSGIMQ